MMNSQPLNQNHIIVFTLNSMKYQYKYVPATQIEVQNLEMTNCEIKSEDSQWSKINKDKFDFNYIHANRSQLKNYTRLKTQIDKSKSSRILSEGSADDSDHQNTMTFTEWNLKSFQNTNTVHPKMQETLYLTLDHMITYILKNKLPSKTEVISILQMHQGVDFWELMDIQYCPKINYIKHLYYANSVNLQQSQMTSQWNQCLDVLQMFELEIVRFEDSLMKILTNTERWVNFEQSLPR